MGRTSAPTVGAMIIPSANAGGNNMRIATLKPRQAVVCPCGSPDFYRMEAFHEFMAIYCTSCGERSNLALINIDTITQGDHD